VVPENDEKRREECKREAFWDPVTRWRTMQEFIALADSQAATPRNSRGRCMEMERAILASWEAKQSLKRGADD
jgi:hypothetical protein